ncbi:hypothetical protein [Sphaerisporangium sp. TRM90804]|uniref:hypothetical protein n=1 Tax=Sphaerisporangium sp. TRM90804 TaxID=3031113 RepID=UPI002448FFB9|nr:hypothetical protein [Sphaerisporangium sp. TRM90804]MDH2424317.1 hypothetical protein [Sphaerisporangium sp. TRM90804]
MAVATAICGGFIALASPATAEAGTVARESAAHTGYAPAAPSTVKGEAGGCDKGSRDKGTRDKGGDWDRGWEKGKRGKDWCCNECPPFPPPVIIPRGDVATTFATPTGLTTGPVQYVAVVQANGTTLLRDPTTILPNPRWNNLSTLAGYPGSVTSVDLAVPTFLSNQLTVTVRNEFGRVAQSTCTLTINPVYPANCTAFVDITPPL